MKNLLDFLIRYSVFILFLILEITALAFIVNNQGYQKSIFLSSSNSIAAQMLEFGNSINDFMKLDDANESLSRENTELKNELTKLKIQLAQVQPEKFDSIKYLKNPELEYHYIAAKVIDCSTNKLQNYITLNKGFLDGIRPDMGVVNEDGVVGIVKTVSKRFSVVIPILNPNIRINSKLARNNYTGSLMWNGVDYRFAELTEIARHVQLKKGDKIVTSGFTKTFPEGIPVGIIDEFSLQESDAYYNIKVRLAVNYRTISHVKVLNYINYIEQKTLEESAQQQ